MVYGPKISDSPLLSAGRVVAFFLMSSGVSALLFGRLFRNLSALSSGFVDRSHTALIVGIACFASGFVLTVVIARRSGRERSQPVWLEEGTSVREFSIQSLHVPATGTRFEDALKARLQAAAQRTAISTRSANGEVGPEQRRLSDERWLRQLARPDNTRWHATRVGPLERVVLATLAAVVVGWIGCATLTYVFKDMLVFNPRGLSAARLEHIARNYPHAEELWIRVDPDVSLHGWLLPPAAPHNETLSSGMETEFATAVGAGREVPLILVFAGQGGEASAYFELAKRVPHVAWAFINYRGYGLSEGSPSDEAFFRDAVAIYDYFTSRADIDGDNVFALGGSLGTGVATYLAAHRPLAGVVLFSPYDRIGGGVAQDLMPWLPTKVLFTNRFDAAAYAPGVRAPALAIVGEGDAVIRPERSRALLREWGQPHRLMVVADGDHYSVYENDNVWRAVDGFVRGLLR